MLTGATPSVWQVVLCLLSTLFLMKAPALESAITEPGTTRWNLADTAEMLAEGPEELSLEAVAARSSEFQPIPEGDINLGLRREAYWFRFNITNSRDVAASFYVELGNARIKRADFYAPGQAPGQSHQWSGTSLPVSQRSLPYRNAVFRLTLDPGQTQTVYLRVYHRGSYRFGLTLWEEGAFIVQNSLRNGLYGMYYGSLAIMFLFDLILSWLFRDRSFLLLSMVIACVGLYMLAYERLDTQYLWPTATSLPGSRLNVLIGLGLFASFQFSRSFLGTAGHAPLWDRIFQVYSILSLCICVDWFVESIWTDWLMQAVGGTSPLVLMAGAITRLRQGHRYALGYIVTWGAMFASMIAFALLGAGLLPQNVVFEHGPKVAFPLALLLISIGIWQRFRELQDTYTSTLETQVAERTRELSEALENVKTLHGLIPICSACKNIRDDQGFWTRVETYIRDRSDADFTHGICPDCMVKLYNRPATGASKKETGS